MKNVIDFDDYNIINEGIGDWFTAVKGTVTDKMKKAKLVFDKMLLKGAERFDLLRQYFRMKYGSDGYNMYMIYCQKKGYLKNLGITYIPVKDMVVPELELSEGAQTITQSLDISEGVTRDFTSLESSKIVNVNTAELNKMIEYTWRSKKYALMIWGAPGIGKTKISYSIGNKFKVPVLVVDLSIREHVDFIGVPSIKGNRTIYNVPDIFPDADSSKDGGIMFFDEINRTSHPVQNAAMQLIHERRIGNNYKLPENWIIIAAGNRIQDDPNTIRQMGGALKNRFKHVNFTPTVEEWLEFVSSLKLDKVLSADMKKNIAQDIRVFSDDFLRFIQTDSKWLHRIPVDSDEEESAAFPTHRKWTEAFEEIRTVETQVREETGDPKYVMPLDEIKLVLSAHVGAEAAQAYIVWSQVAKEFDFTKLENIYTKPSAAPKFEVSNLEMKFALIYAIVDYGVFKVTEGGKVNLKLAEKQFSSLIDYVILKAKEKEFSMPILAAYTRTVAKALETKKLEEERKEWARFVRDTATEKLPNSILVVDADDPDFWVEDDVDKSISKAENSAKKKAGEAEAELIQNK